MLRRQFNAQYPPETCICQLVWTKLEYALFRKYLFSILVVVLKNKGVEALYFIWVLNLVEFLAAFRIELLITVHGSNSLLHTDLGFICLGRYHDVFRIRKFKIFCN